MYNLRIVILGRSTPDGLTFIHALAFRAFGVNLISLRICVFLFFLAWLPAV